ncbi:protein YraM [Enterobacter cloacae]|uniref:Protein YraM n=1 Tax=Enterobacter cloacae TaxID=550 RepID=A0A377LS73_ENTCL|nr:protein YraM [Enterobacter cloacae]
MLMKTCCRGGWICKQMWFNNRSDPNMLKAGITDWQTRYPQNPGAKMLPTQLVNVQNFKPASTSKIALLLPLNGQAAVFGRTIQQGFEAAKNGTTPVTGSAVPAQAAQAANVNDVVSPSAAETSDLTTAQTPPQGTMAEPGDGTDHTCGRSTRACDSGRDTIRTGDRACNSGATSTADH